MKCQICKKTFSSEPAYCNDCTGEYFCSRICLNKYIKERQELEGYRELQATVRRIFHMQRLTPRMYAEIKRFKEKDGITYKNQAAILHYIYEVAHASTPTETLYLIPIYKNEAHEHYMRCKRIGEQVVPQLEPTREVKPNYNPIKSPKKKEKLINPEDV